MVFVNHPEKLIGTQFDIKDKEGNLLSLTIDDANKEKGKMRLKDENGRVAFVNYPKAKERIVYSDFAGDISDDYFEEVRQAVFDTYKKSNSDARFDSFFEGNEVPDELKSIAIAIMKRFTISGVCDGMYLCNRIALESGIGDGNGTFYNGTISDFERVAESLQSAYGHNIYKDDLKELEDILRYGSLDREKAMTGIENYILNCVKEQLTCDSWRIDYLERCIQEAKRNLSDVVLDSANHVPEYMVWNAIGQNFEISWKDTEELLNKAFSEGLFLVKERIVGFDMDDEFCVIDSYEKLSELWKESKLKKIFDVNGEFNIKADGDEGIFHFEIKKLTEKGVSYNDAHYLDDEEAIYEIIWNDETLSEPVNFAQIHCGCPAIEYEGFAEQDIDFEQKRTMSQQMDSLENRVLKEGKTNTDLTR